MEQKRFVKNDAGFVCVHCGAKVKPLGYSSRDHCPRCLFSRHVDRLPGDRQNDCGGLLVPRQALPDAKKGMVILYRCARCGAETRCRAAADDDGEKLIELTKNRDGEAP